MSKITHVATTSSSPDSTLPPPVTAAVTDDEVLQKKQTVDDEGAITPSEGLALEKQMKPIVHYRDANILVLGLCRMKQPYVQVFTRRTAHLWTANYAEDALLLCPTCEVLICDPEPVVIGHFTSRLGDMTVNLYSEYSLADEHFIGATDMPIRGGLRPEKLCVKYPGELGRLTRLVTRCESASAWAKMHGRETWDELIEYHFEKPAPKHDNSDE